MPMYVVLHGTAQIPVGKRLKGKAIYVDTAAQITLLSHAKQQQRHRCAFVDALHRCMDMRARFQLCLELLPT